MEYDHQGRLLRATDGYGQTTRFAYDGEGHLVAIQDATGGTVTWVPAYDGDGQLVEMVDSTGGSTRYRYDPEGLVIGAEFSDGTLETVDYHDAGFTITQAPPDSPPVRFEHDAQGQLAKMVDAFGQESLFHYDAQGLLVRETSPDGETTDYAYRHSVRRVAPAAPKDPPVTEPMAARATITLPPVTVTASGYANPDWDLRIRYAMRYIPRGIGLGIGRALMAKKAIKFSMTQLQKKFKHAPDFGVNSPWSKKAAEDFKAAIQTHINNSKTKAITGTYRGTQSVTHFYNPNTGLNVMRDSQRNFISG